MSQLESFNLHLPVNRMIPTLRSLTESKSHQSFPKEKRSTTGRFPFMFQIIILVRLSFFPRLSCLPSCLLALKGPPKSTTDGYIALVGEIYCKRNTVVRTVVVVVMVVVVAAAAAVVVVVVVMGLGRLASRRIALYRVVSNQTARPNKPSKAPIF